MTRDMLTKKEIFDLINKQMFDVVFEELNKYFLHNNDSLNALESGLINSFGSINLALFATSLKALVNRDYVEKSELKEKPVIDDYELLCEVNFKVQTENFQSIYKYKKIAAFLLHGETDEHGNDLKWLYNQILYKEGLVKDKSVIIDFNSPLGGSFKRLLEEFCLRFEIDIAVADEEADIINLLTYEIYERLKADHLVCIIKGPRNILNEKVELCKLFDDFLNSINKFLRIKKPDHSFIILFVDDKLVDYKCKEDKYFFWFNAELQSEYSINVAECSDLKIIDLAPIERIKKEDIIKWMQLSLRKRPDVSEKIIKSKAKYILQAGNTPYKAIENICKDLNITIQAKWIS